MEAFEELNLTLEGGAKMDPKNPEEEGGLSLEPKSSEVNDEDDEPLFFLPSILSLFFS